MKTKTKYIVVTKGSSFMRSSLGDFLNTFYRTDGEEAHFRLGTVSKEGFYIPHEIITKIKSENMQWKNNFEFYSQEGGGKIRKYSIPNKNVSAEKKRIKEEIKKAAEKRKNL